MANETTQQPTTETKLSGATAKAREGMDEMKHEARVVMDEARQAIKRPGIGAAVAGAAVLAAGALWGATEAAVAAVAAYAVFRMLTKRGRHERHESAGEPIATQETTTH